MKTSTPGIFTRIINYIETDNYPFLIGWAGLFALITVRNIFESAFESGQVFGFSAYAARSFYMIFSHYPLFYFALFLCFLLTIFLLTGEKIPRVARAMIFGMTVIILPPFIDIIFSRGSGYNLKYIGNIRELSQSFRFFNPLQDLMQSSWGQRAEIVLSLGGAVLYVFLKTKNFIKSLGGAVIFFGIILIFGVIPNFVARIPAYLGFHRFSPNALITAGLFKIDSQNYSILFLFLILLVGFFILKITRRDIFPQITIIKPSLLYLTATAIGLIYGWVMIHPYWPFIHYSPVNFMLIIVSLAAIHFVNIAEPRNHPAEGFYILALFSVFSSIAIGPVYALLIAVFFLFRHFRKPGATGILKPAIRAILILISFCAGFSVIFQNATFAAIIPAGRNAELYGRQLSGWNYFINRDYPAALEQYRQACDIRANDEIRRRIGQCYLHLGQAEPAIKILKNIKRSDYETILILADAYSQIGRTSETLRLYAYALAANIEPAEFTTDIAQIMARRGNREETDRYLNIALAYGIPRFKYYQIRGDLFSQKNDLAAALAAYDRSLGYNPRSVASHAGKGMNYYRQGDLARAESEFMSALKFSPDNFALYNNLGAIALLKKDDTTAEKYFTRSLAINPSQAESYYNLGLIADHAGDHSRANTLYLKALAINPDFSPASDALKKTVQDD
jgi:tetratricopeptide (TPR) repeat protein